MNSKIHFKNLDELIDFERNISWVKDNGNNQFSFTSLAKTKYGSIKGNKLLGVYDSKVVSVVSEEFRPISVYEIAQTCEKEFGNKYIEKSFKEGVIRIYEKGLEDKTGKVTPIVIFPANLGTMAVHLGIYHTTYVCSNGIVISDNSLTERIIHRTSADDITVKARKVSNNMNEILKGVSTAMTKHLSRGEQLGMIIQGLGKVDNLVDKALEKYYPVDQTLWAAIQSITYVGTHETKKGFEYEKNAGSYLIKQKIEPREIIDAASYVFSKEKSINFEDRKDLYTLALDLLADRVLNN